MSIIAVAEAMVIAMKGAAGAVIMVMGIAIQKVAESY